MRTAEATATIARPATPAPAATPNRSADASEFAAPADDATIERTAAALRAKGYIVHVAPDGASAKALALSLVPEGAEVSQGASQTLEDLGITAEIEGGRFDAVRPRTRAMDRTTPEGIRAMRKLGVGPDYYLVSAHALTEDGTFVIASNTGSQLGPIAFGAGEVIFVIGSQKIVPDLETAFRRIDEHSLPLENVRMQKLYGTDSEVKKILIIRKEVRHGRISVILVKEPVGA
jgi:hypothetical protein